MRSSSEERQAAIFCCSSFLGKENFKLFNLTIVKAFWDEPIADKIISLFFALKNCVEPAINNASLELLEKWFVI